MRVLLTGMNGAVAPAFARALRDSDHQVIAWDRTRLPIDSEWHIRAAIDQHNPDWICHIATGPPQWAQWLARACADFNLGFLWTGTVSVFSEAAVAPLTPDLPPDATDEYGRYKIECERLINEANPRAVIARLGWQIGDEPGSNTMTDFLAREAMKHSGPIEASTKWIPSCAFLTDTSAGLLALLERAEPGIFHLEGNSAGLSFFEIASALAHIGDRSWTIRSSDAPARDNRMRDDRVTLGQVARRLGIAL